MPTESAIDSLLVQGAGVKSANELAAETGLEPADIVRRTQEIFDRVSLTAYERRAKLIFMLDEAAAKGQARIDGANDENAARIMNSVAGNVGRVLKELRDSEKDAKEDAAEQDRAIARTLVRIVEGSFNRYLGSLMERYPELDQGEIEAGFQKMILKVAMEYDEQ